MKNSGFTLIEALIIISVLTLILMIAVPKISMDYGYMDIMVRQFVADVRFIQMETMKNPYIAYRITIDKNRDLYYVRKQIAVEKKVTFKKRYIINYSNKDSIRFNYNGTPINAGTFTITDTKTNRTKSVSIVPTTGRTIVME